MPFATPVQIVVCRDTSDWRTDEHVEMLGVAFEGSAKVPGSPNAYLADAVGLGIRVLEPAEDLTDSEIRAPVRGARETVVAVVGAPSAQSKALGNEVGPDNIVPVDGPQPVGDGSVLGDKGPGEEPAFAPVVAALRAMECARRVLAGKGGGSLKLFISHAKTDGLAMARSLIGILRQLQDANCGAPGFEYFYDAEHIEPGSVWREVLEANASEAVLIALRTGAYESGYWCRREFLLAESNGMPILAVDLRNGQFNDSALLPFEVMPCVRVHDGNLIRVVLRAMAVRLRALRVQSAVKPGLKVKVLPHRPSVYSMAAAGTGSVGFDRVAHPGPKVPGVYEKAVDPILSAGGSPTKLVTFDELE
ncbi:MAG: toll/interleukin-1 receptor domain-containing protein [Albidovulum sp.]|nr:toll/interleukin-1 receptor domain-containing protein [Albidovulum sp.]MDE0532954.1 toll/interleukin-1 receptor domain-containing protein [Albidovulum sp.]